MLDLENRIEYTPCLPLYPTDQDNPYHQDRLPKILVKYTIHCDIDIHRHYIHLFPYQNKIFHRHHHQNNQHFHRILHANRDTKAGHYDDIAEEHSMALELSYQMTPNKLFFHKNELQQFR
jgi:hypothetical protein